MNNILKNNLIKSIGIYTFSSILNSAIPFFLLPVFTRYLSPEDYGITSMFLMIISLVNPVVGLSSNASIQKRYYDEDSIDISEYIYNCLLILCISGICTLLLFNIFSDYIEYLTSLTSIYIYIPILLCISNFIFSIVLFYFQYKKAAIKYAVFSNFNTLLNFILSIIFVIIFGYGWRGRIHGQFISTLIISLIAFYILIKNKMIKSRFNKSYIKMALSFSVPLIPHHLSGTILSFTDRFFIKMMVGLSETGIYSVGYQIGSIINIIAISFNTAYVPWLFGKLKENNYITKLKIVKLTYVYFVVILCISLLLGLISPYIFNIFLGKDFSNSSIYVIWIAIGYAFNGMYFMVTNYIFYVEKTSYLATVTFISGILNIVLNYFFINRFGAIGASQATAIIYVIKFFMVWFISARVYKMPWIDIFFKNKK